METTKEAPYQRLRKVNVSDRTEKKNGMTYLSWAYAVDQLLQEDSGATWEYPTPVMYGDTMMVFCSVTAFGKTMTAQLPVMDHRNKSIPNPDAFAVNTAMQRCLVKAIALHGLGLYIYAGEDLPADVTMQHDPRPDTAGVIPARIAKAVAVYDAIVAKDIDEDAEALELFDMHTELAREPELYQAVADELANTKRISKLDWKAAVKKGKELANRIAA